MSYLTILVVGWLSLTLVNGQCCCQTRGPLITIDASNHTILVDSIQAVYVTWSLSVKSGFNSYYNQIKDIIWKNTVYNTIEKKIPALISVFQGYNANNKPQQLVLWRIDIAGWGGNITDFIYCKNLTLTTPSLSTILSSTPSTPSVPSESPPTGSTPPTGPTVSPPTGPTGPTGPTVSPPTDPTVSPPTGPTVSPPTGPTDPTGSPPTGPTVSPPTSPTVSPPTGPTDPTVSPPTGPTDPTGTPPTGPTVSPPTGPTVSPPTGPTDPTGTPPTGPTVSPPTDPTVSPPTGPTVSPPTGPTDPTVSPPTGSTVSPPTGPTDPTGSPPTGSPPTGPTVSPPTDPTVSPPTGPTVSPPTGPTDPTGSPPTDSTVSPPTDSTTEPSTSPSTTPASTCPAPANTASLIFDSTESGVTKETENKVCACSNPFSQYYFDSVGNDPNSNIPSASFQCVDPAKFCMCTEDNECFQQLGDKLSKVEFVPYCEGSDCHMYTIIYDDFSAGNGLTSGGRNIYSLNQIDNDMFLPTGTGSPYLKAKSASCNGCAAIQVDVCSAGNPI